MSGKATCIAVAVRRVRAVQTEGRAISLDVAQTLAVVALLRFGGAGQRAVARLVIYSAPYVSAMNHIKVHRGELPTWLLAYFTCQLAGLFQGDFSRVGGDIQL